MKTMKSLAKYINEKFKVNFPTYRIQYRVDKLLKENFGQPDEDAYKFTKLCEDDASKNGGYFKYEENEVNIFESAIYVSETMLTYAEEFLDVVIVDSTYKRNRFNLPIVNVIGINNYGQNILLAFALIKNETKESYMWIFRNLKHLWSKNPHNFVCDQCPSIRYGKHIILTISYKSRYYSQLYKPYYQLCLAYPEVTTEKLYIFVQKEPCSP